MTAFCSLSLNKPKLSEEDSIIRAAPPFLYITTPSEISANGSNSCDAAVNGLSGADKKGMGIVLI
jgi:hypothetical protein